MKRRAVDALAIVLILAPSIVSAETATLVAIKDNSIFANNPDNSNGGGAGIFSGTTGLGTPCRGLVEFDIAGNLPAGATIAGVQLRMYLGMSPNTNPQDIELHRLTKDWGEGTDGSSNPIIMMSGMGYPAGAGDATWNDAKFGSAAWSSPGSTGDFNQTASATITVSGPIDAAFVWNSTPAMISDVQSWLNSPSLNFGWELINADEVKSRTQKVFYSRQATRNSSGDADSLDVSWRPTLVVDYISPSIPTGDYNGNGVVDAADYAVWRKTLSSAANPAGSGADGNQNSLIDASDYIFWRARYGNPVSGLGTGAVIAEPATIALFLLAAPLAFFRTRR